MFRREWRQQLLVVTLLTVAVAAAIGSITIAYNAVPADDGDFGSANQLLMFDGVRSAKARGGARRRQEIVRDDRRHRPPLRGRPRQRRDGGLPVANPGGAYGGELLALRRGSYPEGPGEVAVTDGVAESLRLEIGSTLALDGHRRTVVGIVENPRKLSDEFALVSPRPRAPDRVDVLVDASDRVDRLLLRSRGDAPARPSRAP